MSTADETPLTHTLTNSLMSTAGGSTATYTISDSSEPDHQVPLRVLRDHYNQTPMKESSHTEGVRERRQKMSFKDIEPYSGSTNVQDWL